MLHYHDRYEIGFCEKGSGLFLSEGRFASVQKGDLIFVPPQHRHYSRSLYRDDPCFCRFVYLRPEALTPLLPLDAATISHLAEHIPTVIRPDEYPQAASLLLPIMELCQKTSRNQDHLTALRLSILLLEAETRFPSAVPPLQVPSTGGIAADIAEYISLHYRENPSAKELASRVHLSESQLRRQFVAAYGIPPILYRSRLRCRIAAELLVQTELSIAAISDQIGYTSPSDFYRAFRALYALSPSEYRKKRRTN